MLEQLIDFLRTLWTPDRLIPFLGQILTSWVGYATLFGIVFAETGLLVGFIFPGDSLLFTIGVVVGAGDLNIVAVCAVLVIAAILGDQSGYFLGLPHRSEDLQPSRLALLQAGLRPPDARLL